MYLLRTGKNIIEFSKEIFLRTILFFRKRRKKKNRVYFVNHVSCFRNKLQNLGNTRMKYKQHAGQVVSCTTRYIVGTKH